MFCSKVNQVLRIGLALVYKIGGAFLKKEMKAGWDIVRQSVDMVAGNNQLTSAQKRDRVIELVKSEYIRRGQEIKDSSINFMIELNVLIKKYLPSA